jgi:hypothetical protein
MRRAEDRQRDVLAAGCKPQNALLCFHMCVVPSPDYPHVQTVTGLGVGPSLCANEPGGTCSFPSSVPPPAFPTFHPVRRIGALFFLPPAAPRKLAEGIDDGAVVTTLVGSLRVAAPARCDFASDTKHPHFRSRSTSCFRPLSMLLREIPIFYSLLEYLP